MIKKEVSIALLLIASVNPLIVNPLADDGYYLPKTIFLYLMYIVLVVILFKIRKDVTFSIEEKILILFLSLGIISTMFSIEPLISIMGTRYRYEGILILIFYGLIYYFSKNYLEVSKRALKVVLIVVMIVSVHSILQFYDIDPIPKDAFHEVMSNNAIGTQGHRNFLSSYLTLFLPGVLIAYLIKGRRRYLCISAIGFTSLLCTLTRSGWISFGIYFTLGNMFVLVKYRSKYLLRILAIAVVFASIYTFIDVSSKGRLTNRNEELIHDTKTAVENKDINGELGSARGYIWQIAIKSIKNKPILGTGPDTFKNNVDRYFEDDGQDYIEKYGATIDKAHNEYLQIAVTMGIPSLILYLTFLMIVLKNNCKGIFKNNINFIITVTIISYLIQSFFNISVINVAPIFWILLGLSQNPQGKRLLEESL